LTGARAFVATECIELGGDRTDLVARRTEDRERRERGITGVAVERAALHGRGEQRLVAVLAMEVDERRADVGKLGDGGDAPVDVGARPAIAGEHTREDHFAPLVGLEAPFDACFGRALPDERGVGTPPEEQLDRLDEQRLAGTGLAGDRGAAGIEQHGDVVDDPEVSDVELAEHGRHRSARPNLAFRIWWKSRGPNVTT